MGVNEHRVLCIEDDRGHGFGALTPTFGIFWSQKFKKIGIGKRECIGKAFYGLTFAGMSRISRHEMIGW